MTVLLECFINIVCSIRVVKWELCKVKAGTQTCEIASYYYRCCISGYMQQLNIISILQHSITLKATSLDNGRAHGNSTVELK